MRATTGQVFVLYAEREGLHVAELDELWLASIPADVATALKKAYRKHGAVDVDASEPRKPEWLSENLDNPFRDWDGRDGITPANAKIETVEREEIMDALARGLGGLPGRVLREGLVSLGDGLRDF